ncbi:MAG: 50S ribosomal protein L22 [Nitrospinae bacterium]|nr:50S ribosomal protein L22 [Nitrospinota bacterium]
MEAIQASATLRFTRVAAQKARLVADMIRGKKVADAKGMLSFSPKKSAGLMLKLLNSAVANAEAKNVEDPEILEVSGVWVNQGPAMRRQRPRARGRADILRRPTAHITIVVKENEEAKRVQSAKLAAVEAKKAKKRAAKAEGAAKAEPKEAKDAPKEVKEKKPAKEAAEKEAAKPEKKKPAEGKAKTATKPAAKKKAE